MLLEKTPKLNPLLGSWLQPCRRKVSQSATIIAAIVLMRTKVNYIKIMLLKMGRLKPIVIQPDLAIVNTKQV